MSSVNVVPRPFRLDAVRRVLRLAALGLGLAGAGLAGAADPARPEPAVADCPHCGTWELVRSEPSGAAGERIVVGPGTVTLPTCGEFGIDETDLSWEDDAGGRRRYRAALRLRPTRPERLCASVDEGLVRLEVQVSDALRAGGAGIAQFSVFRDDSDAPRLTALGWNAGRDDPCASGAAPGALACAQLANARLVRNVAQAVYEARLDVPGAASMRANDALDPARFAAATLQFCRGREGEAGGAAWPEVGALECQAERLQDKLAQLRAFRTCVAAGGSRCSFPNERFDRSPARP